VRSLAKKITLGCSNLQPVQFFNILMLSLFLGERKCIVFFTQLRPSGLVWEKVFFFFFIEAVVVELGGTRLVSSVGAIEARKIGISACLVNIVCRLLPWD
jgi:hypothetical protein